MNGLIKLFSVSENELKRLKDAFKRSSTLSGFMTRNVFIREVLGDGVPIKLAEVRYVTIVFDSFKFYHL